MSDSHKVNKEAVYWDIERLVPYEKNAKKHDESQVEKIAASIREVGFEPGSAIVVDKDGVIIAGHGRRLAAKKLGMPKVPVIVRDDLTPEQVRAYRLIDNRVSEGGYDTEMMADELASLVNDNQFDMSSFFDERELNFATDDLGSIDMDAISDDLHGEVEEHSEKTQESIDSEDEKEVSIAKALGFSKATTTQARSITRLMALAEGETGKSGAQALSEYARDYVGV